MFKPELLSPVGTPENIRYASAYDADAVYAGQPCYSLRVRNNEFNHENLQLGTNEAHGLGKKFYVVVNIAPHNAKSKTFIRDLKPVVEVGLDALTISDPGLIMLVRESFPDMDTHLSVQANVVNWVMAKFWKQMGLTRVVLSHELPLEEIEEIRTQAPDMELEVFVHGALCMAYSGRCLLFGCINKRDSNQGTCTNACHWEYNVQEGKEDVMGSIVYKYEPIPVQNVEPMLGTGAPTDKVFMVEGAQRPDGYMTVLEDERGTYITNSKDLCVITHVERLTQMGVHSLRIEGHTKSYYYCARIAQVYHRAIDDAAASKPFDPQLLETLEDLTHRGCTERFLRCHTHDDYQNYEYGFSISERWQFAGESTGERKGKLAVVLVKNKLTVGDNLELMTPQGNTDFTLEQLESAKGEAMSVVPGDGYTVWMPVPEDTDLNYALLMCNSTGESMRNPRAKQLITVIFQRPEDSQKSITYRFAY